MAFELFTRYHRHFRSIFPPLYKNAQINPVFAVFFSTCNHREIIVNKKFTYFYIKSVDTGG